jgi:hypothetical protein
MRRVGKARTVTTSDPGQATQAGRPVPTADDLFGNSELVHSADDLARGGIFDDGEVEEFLVDLYAMRRSGVA